EKIEAQEPTPILVTPPVTCESSGSLMLMSYQKEISKLTEEFKWSLKNSFDEFIMRINGVQEIYLREVSELKAASDSFDCIMNESNESRGKIPHPSAANFNDDSRRGNKDIAGCQLFETVSHESVGLSHRTLIK
ncbi:hypothetical protein MXB_134, partial [Myxobolus squamalis]